VIESRPLPVASQVVEFTLGAKVQRKLDTGD